MIEVIDKLQGWNASKSHRPWNNRNKYWW